MCRQMLCDKESTTPGIKCLVHCNDIAYPEVVRVNCMSAAAKNQWWDGNCMDAEVIASPGNLCKVQFNSASFYVHI